MMRAAYVGAVAACAVATASSASADRYEATVVVRPFGAATRLHEAGAPNSVEKVGGGVTAGLSYGLRNWLDIDAELAGVAFGVARYEGAIEPLGGTARTGSVERTTRLAQLRLGAKLRFGVAWVPTVFLGAGPGARLRSNANFVRSGSDGFVTPDGGDAAVTFDAVTTAHVGLEHRLGEHWTLGVAVGATHCFGFGAPDISVFEGAATVSYMWYPLW